MKGRIISTSGGVYSVLSDGVIYRSFARGLFRHKKIKPVVGDIVEIDETSFAMTSIDERKSFLKRPLISNIDRLIIVFSVCQPDFSFLLAFKYLTYANLYGIPCSIVLTKIDKTENKEEIAKIKEVFETMNIDVRLVCNKTKEGIEEIKTLLEGKTTCFMGQTGVGKSSLINNIDENYERKIGEYSYALGRGKHQTKEVVLLPYKDGFIADTPGFSSLDLELFKEDLAEYFPCFGDYYTKCYFSNCLHISESKCEVKKAISEGKIPQIAYDCYIKLSNETISKSKEYIAR